MKNYEYIEIPLLSVTEERHKCFYYQHVNKEEKLSNSSMIARKLF